MSRRIIVFGAGVAGLATAFQLHRRGANVVVLERAARTGGTIRTLPFHGSIVDTGPEIVALTRPEAARFCDSIGLTSAMIPADETLPTLIASAHGAGPLPDGLSLGVPRSLRALASTRVLSWRGKVRSALDLVLPAKSEPALGPLIDRRLGREVTERLIEPLFGGIYGCDVARLETAFVAPSFARAKRSILRAIANEQRPTSSPLRAPTRGMGQLVETLVERLGEQRVRLNVHATSISRSATGWDVVTSDGESLAADGVVLAVPPHAAASLALAIDADLAARLRNIRSTSTASVVLGWETGTVAIPAVSALFVARADAGPLLSATIVSNRWPTRTAHGSVIVRVIVGGARAPGLAESGTDDDLVREALAALRPFLLLASPRWHHVVRFPHAQVSPEVGHMAKVEHARVRARELGNIQLIGAAYDGGGIAGILSRADATAARALDG